MADHSYQFHVPKRLETLAAFNKALLNAFPMVAKVELEKSRANDWNDQLKEQLRSQTQAAAPTQQPTPLPAPTPTDAEPTPAPRRGPRL